MKVLCLLFVLILSLSFKIELFPERNNLKSKLPSYLGKGYDLLKGNPFTDKVDEGFRASIFDFSYAKNLTTDDGKYLIPDHTSSA